MATINLKTSFFILSFLLYLFPAKAIIDGGAPIKVGWGSTSLPVPAGQHSVTVYFPYLFQAGKATTMVTLAEGQSVNLDYRAPLVVFFPGKLKTV